MSFMHCSVMGHLIKSLIEGGTADQIAQVSGHEPNTVRRYMRVWKRIGIVYIKDYKSGSGKHYKPTKVWALRTAGQADATPPAPLTNNERCARYRERRELKRKIEEKLERVRGKV